MVKEIPEVGGLEKEHDHEDRHIRDQEPLQSGREAIRPGIPVHTRALSVRHWPRTHLNFEHNRTVLRAISRRFTANSAGYRPIVPIPGTWGKAEMTLGSAG